MSYTDERTTRQFSKYGFIKEFIFLALIIAIIIYRVISKVDIISIMLLSIVPIVSVIVLVKRINKKSLSLNEIISGIAASDERIVNIIDAAGMLAIGFGTGILFVYCIYGALRFSTQSIALELLLTMLVCSDIAIEGRYINKSYVACTGNGFESPYYDDNKKKKEITKRIIKSWIKYAIAFTIIDVIRGIFIMKETLSVLIFKYSFVLLEQLAACLVFAVADILIMKWINKKIYKQME